MKILKRFSAWLYRVDDLVKHSSLLSLLISLLASVFFFGIVVLLAFGFPDYLLNLRSSFFAEGFTYELWLMCISVYCCFFWLFFVSWFFDLVKYIVSLFRKSSAPADDK